MLEKVELEPMPDDIDDEIEATLPCEDTYEEPSTLDSLLASPVRLSICFSTSIEEVLWLIICVCGKLDAFPLAFFRAIFLVWFVKELCPLVITSPKLSDEAEFVLSKLVNFLFF